MRSIVAAVVMLTAMSTTYAERVIEFPFTLEGVTECQQARQDMGVIRKYKSELITINGKPIIVTPYKAVYVSDSCWSLGQWVDREKYPAITAETKSQTITLYSKEEIDRYLEIQEKENEDRRVRAEQQRQQRLSKLGL